MILQWTLIVTVDMDRLDLQISVPGYPPLSRIQHMVRPSLISGLVGYMCNCDAFGNVPEGKLGRAICGLWGAGLHPAMLYLAASIIAYPKLRCTELLLREES